MYSLYSVYTYINKAKRARQKGKIFMSGFNAQLDHLQLGKDEAIYKARSPRLHQ